MTRKKRRLYTVLAGLAVLGLATALVLKAFEQNIVFFFTPSELAEKEMPDGRRFRLGGLVEDGSVVSRGQMITEFRVTDLQRAVPVVYRGLLPDLFREGQGVIAEGALGGDGVFMATEVLAKHDETYMPSEVADALRKSGQWQGQ
ncbi:MAG: cytochrome c maturation protein CcmE [Sphingomonadales bacterium]